MPDDPTVFSRMQHLYHIPTHLHNFSNKTKQNKTKKQSFKLTAQNGDYDYVKCKHTPMLTFSEKNLHGMHQTKTQRRRMMHSKKCEILTNKNVEQYFINFYVNWLADWLSFSSINICYQWNLLCIIDFYFSVNLFWWILHYLNNNAHLKLFDEQTQSKDDLHQKLRIYLSILIRFSQLIFFPFSSSIFGEKKWQTLRSF